MSCQAQVEDLEERMETQKKAAASYEKQKTEMGKERDLLLDELEQMKQIKVGSLITVFSFEVTLSFTFDIGR